MRNLIILFLLFFIACSEEKSSEYPIEILKNNIESFYDAAKWNFYVLNCNDSSFVDIQTHKTYSFNILTKECRSELDVFDDSFLLYFFIHDSIDYFSKNEYFISRFMTNKESIDTVLYAFPGKFKFSLPSIIDDIYNDTIKYIEEYRYFKQLKIIPFNQRRKIFIKELKKQENKLTPWLKKMAKRKGILK